MPKQRVKDEAVRKITRTGGYTYYVTIPKDELDELGWREGEKVQVHRKGTRIIIEKK